ncbi:alpha/beta hydrolase [uncultured Allofournierella sp.]|uniref:alpha/beta hydrolase n=1 Tax=uncultured Allofournierella sp. TaxID=1940258 RepID=UPI003753E369
MALLNCKFKSQALMSPTTVRVYLPTEGGQGSRQEPIKGVFTLLHGYTNDGDDWIQMVPVVRYARENNLALVIPDAANSFYHDTAAQQAYYTWLTKEMPVCLAQTVALPTEREQNFVCGLSMGGYGALLLGLSQPERYAGCASFSGAVAVHRMLEQSENPLVRFAFEPVYGPALELPPERDLFHLARRAAELPKEQQPKILCTTGRQDHEPYYIYQQNQEFRAAAHALGLDYTYMEWDGGHDWAVWDRSLVYAMDLFVSPGYANRVLGAWDCPVYREGGRR